MGLACLDGLYASSLLVAGEKIERGMLVSCTTTLTVLYYSHSLKAREVYYYLLRLLFIYRSFKRARWDITGYYCILLLYCTFNYSVVIVIIKIAGSVSEYSIAIGLVLLIVARLSDERQ